jgi:acyl dehydratase
MTQARVFTTVGELRDAIGQEMGPTEWQRIDQKRVDLFAEATGDHQWIHVDPEKAANGPFGTTIAHGYLTLSLIPSFSSQLFSVEGVKMGVNYGVNKVRFPSIVPVGSRLRASARVADVSDVPGGVQLVTHITVEREDGDKPVCVAETVARFYL